MAQTNVQAFSGDVEISSNLAVSGSKFTYDNTKTTVFTGTSSGGANEIGVWNVGNNSADNTFIDVWVIGTNGINGNQMHYRVYNRPDAGGSTAINTFERDKGSIAPVVYRTNADDMSNGVIRIGYENSYSQFITWRVKVTTRYTTQGVFQVTNTGSAVDGTGLVQVTPAPATELTSNLMVGGSDLFVDTVKSTVGIGTTNPETTLDIVSTTTSTNTPVTGLLLQGTTSGTATDGFGTKMEFRAERGDGTVQTKCGTIDVSGRNLAGAGDVWDMRFNVRNDESIDTLLNLQSTRGVRTFQGLRAESTENHSFDRYFPGNGEFPDHTLSLLYQNTRSYNTGPGINFSGSYSTSSAFMQSYATIKGVADSPSGNEGALRFYVNKGSGANSQTQVMKIDSNGTVEIQKQNPTGNWTGDDPCLRLTATNASPSYIEFDNNRSWVFKSSGTDQGSGLILDSTVSSKFFTLTNTGDVCFDFYTVPDNGLSTSVKPYLRIPNGYIDIYGHPRASYDDITGANQILTTASRNQIYAGSPAGGGDYMWFVGTGGSGTIANRIIMTLNGNSGIVGIGTTEPAYDLDVNGNWRLRGTGAGISSNSTFDTSLNDLTGFGIAAMKLNTSWLMRGLSGARSYYLGLAVDSPTSTVTANLAWAFSGGANPDPDPFLLMTTNSYIYAKRFYQNGTLLSSDDRIKNNEKRITNAKQTLLKLSPQTYEKSDSFKNPTSNSYSLESGLIVQDVWYDAPELRHLVDLPEDATPTETRPISSTGDIQDDPDYSQWGSRQAYLSYTGFVPYLIKSVQELDTEQRKTKTCVDDINYSNVMEYSGLIVCADTNTTKNGIPRVTLSQTSTDKSCFGVISGVTDTNDNEVFIQNYGHGHMWVTDVNGALESGDYITTSNVAGYGQKQDSEFLGNYTVAKITQDCNFTPSLVATKRVVQELRDVTYYQTTTHVDIGEDEYNNLSEESRMIVTKIKYRLKTPSQLSELTDDEMVLFKECEEIVKSLEGLSDTVRSFYSPFEETFHMEIKTKLSEFNRPGSIPVTKREMVNVLDEYGQLQWEDTDETEQVYEIRYLDTDGNITDEANTVHKAALVGCTIHCG